MRLVLPKMPGSAIGPEANPGLPCPLSPPGTQIEMPAATVHPGQLKRRVPPSRELRLATGRWAAVSAPFQRLGLACGMAVGPRGRPAGGRRAGESDMRRSSKRVSMPAGQDPQ